MINSLEINEQDIQTFYEFFNHTQPTEIRVFDKEKYPDGKSVFVKNYDEFLSAVKKYTEEKVNSYIGGRNRIGTKTQDIVSTNFVFLEIDEHNINKPEMKQKVEEFLKNNNIEIGLCGFSGGGYHFYLPHTKIEFINEEHRNLSKLFLTSFKNAMLNNKIDIDPKVFDLPRVSRILGTYNFQRNQLSKILYINKDIDLKKNFENIKKLAIQYEIKNIYINTNVIELLKKYNINKSDIWLYDLLNKQIEIKPDTGGNSIVFKNAAIILTRENIPIEERNIITKELAKLCKNRMLSALEGWIKKCEDGSISKIYRNEINKWILDTNYQLTPYVLNEKEREENLKYYEAKEEKIKAGNASDKTFKQRQYENQFKEEKESNLKFKRTKTSAADIANMKFEKPDYWIKDLLPKSATIVIGSKAGKGKTLYLLAQMISMTKGQSFLERFPIMNEPNKMLYIDLDDNGFQSLHWKIQYLLNGSGNNIEIRKKIDFQQEFDVNDLKAELENIKPYDIIVLDSYRRFLKGDENDSEVTNRFFKTFIKPAKEMGKTIVLLHHFKKGDMSQISDQDLIDSFRGSSDLPTQVQVAYGLIQSNEEEDIQNGTLKFNLALHRAKDRDAIVVKSFNFNVLKDERNQTTTFKWNGYGGLKKEKQNRAQRKLLLDYVQSHPNSSRNDILSVIERDSGLSAATIDRYLKDAILVGELIKTRYGLYKIRETSSEQALL